MVPPAVSSPGPLAVARRLTRIAFATAMLAALALAVAGCATPGSGIQAGEHVTIYVSMPLRGPEAVEGRDVVGGAKLALTDAHGKVGRLAVRAVYLDDTAGRGASARWSPAVAAANARQASEDSTAIAYLGDLDSGASRFSLPITNQARMLQVSPGSGAVDLVQPFLGAGDELPKDVQPSGERTFGRVIPSDAVQAAAAALWAKRLGARSVGALSDGSRFGDTMVTAFRQAASGLPRTGPRQADLLYYGGTAADVPVPVKRDLFSCSRQTLIASDAMFGAALFRRIPTGVFHCPEIPAGEAAPRGVLVTSAAEDPAQLPAAGQRFVRAFGARYGRKPDRYAAYGYEAMAVALDSIRRAGDRGDDRDSVVNAFFDTQGRDSVLGAYSIDDVGDTTLNALAGYRLSDGRLVFANPLRVR
jgi:branched-chain amino acid transport system substrate-binding protein